MDFSRPLADPVDENPTDSRVENSVQGNRELSRPLADVVDDLTDAELKILLREKRGHLTERQCLVTHYFNFRLLTFHN